MSKTNKVITGKAIHVKYLDGAMLKEKGQRVIVKDYVAPVCLTSDAAGEDFVKKATAGANASGLLVEFEFYEATMKLGKRTIWPTLGIPETNEKQGG